MTNRLAIDNVTVRFGGVVAVNNVSLRVAPRTIANRSRRAAAVMRRP